MALKQKKEKKKDKKQTICTNWINGSCENTKCHYLHRLPEKFMDKIKKQILQQQQQQQQQKQSLGKCTIKILVSSDKVLFSVTQETYVDDTEVLNIVMPKVNGIFNELANIQESNNNNEPKLSTNDALLYDTKRENDNYDNCDNCDNYDCDIESHGDEPEDNGEDQEDDDDGYL